MLLPEYLNQVIVTILNVNKHHINSGNHDILCNGVAQVEHVVNHLPFFRLNDSLFMAHIHNGPELILCDIVIFLIGVHMKGLKHNQRHPVNEDNKRGQHGHQNTCPHQKHQHGNTPHETVDSIVHICNELYHNILLLCLIGQKKKRGHPKMSTLTLPPDFCFDLFFIV